MPAKRLIRIGSLLGSKIVVKTRMVEGRQRVLVRCVCGSKVRVWYQPSDVSKYTACHACAPHCSRLTPRVQIADRFGLRIVRGVRVKYSGKPHRSEEHTS